jgi:uncharacterized protein YbjT (DUF2867 family)
MGIFISGGTGYMGRELARRLVTTGRQVRVLARPGSENKVPRGAMAVRGNALDASTFAGSLAADDTLVHLTGTAHPAPWKGRQFQEIDLASLKASVEAAQTAGVKQFVYVSVAHPAPVMKAYIEVRTECERILAGSGIHATILRPWYVLGPGHRWPVVLRPAYALLRAIPATREGARRLGLVTLPQMVDALTWAVENPSTGIKILEVPEIRSISSR